LGRPSDDNLQASLRRGTVWVGIANGLSGVLDAVSTPLCLWLWVSKAELGVATFAAALFPVLERIANLGLSSAAVRRADAGRRELSSLFWLNLASAGTLFALALLVAPAIGRSYGHSMALHAADAGEAINPSILGWLVFAFAGKLVLQSTYMVPEALLRRALKFETLSKVKIVAFLADGGTKLGTAYLGAHGHPDLRIWCFVVGPIASTIVMAVGCQLVEPWRPRWTFDKPAAAAAARFGISLSLADAIYFAYTSADYLVIGAVFGAEAVGAYRLAYELVLDVVRLVSMVTAEVAFPAVTRLAGDARAVGEQLLALTRQNLLLVAPLLVVIGVAASDVLAILYPSPGADATTAAQILCVVGALRSISFVLPAVLAGLGHARDALVYNVIAAVVCTSSIVIAANVWRGAGYVSVAWAWAASYPIAFAALVWLVLARTGVSVATYARSVLPIVAWAIFTAGLAFAVRAALPADKWLGATGVAVTTLASYGMFSLARRAAVRS
jgi:O-antigen/teichoic acid export membrane protein